MKIIVLIPNFCITIYANKYSGLTYMTLKYIDKGSGTHEIGDILLGLMDDSDLPRTKEDCFYILGYYWLRLVPRGDEIGKQQRLSFHGQIRGIPEFRCGYNDWILEVG